MIFKKKKGMIDVRELQKRGVVRLPKKDFVIPTNREGFVEFGSSGKKTPKKTSPPQTNTELFGFMDTPSTSTSRDEFSKETGGYNKQEVDTKITNLDNKIYKLEQRVELLEKKQGIATSENSNIGVMGW